MHLLFSIFNRLRLLLIRPWGSCYMRMRGVTVGKGLRAIGAPSINGVGRIYIGNSCVICSHEAYTQMGVVQRCKFNTLTESARIRMGDKCAISGVVLCAKESVVLGNRVMIGSGAVICDTDFHSLIRNRLKY